MHSYASCPSCNGKHRKHIYKDGCKKAETSEVKEDKSAADIPAKKPEKKVASGDAKVDPPSKLISMPPPAKTVTPPTYRKTEKSPDFGTPFEHSKIPSSSSGAQKPDVPPAAPDMPVKPDPQEETKEDKGRRETNTNNSSQREEGTKGFSDIAVSFAENS